MTTCTVPKLLRWQSIDIHQRTTNACLTCLVSSTTSNIWLPHAVYLRLELIPSSFHPFSFQLPICLISTENLSVPQDCLQQNPTATTACAHYVLNVLVSYTAGTSCRSKVASRLRRSPTAAARCNTPAGLCQPPGSCIAAVIKWVPFGASRGQGGAGRGPSATVGLHTLLHQ